MGTYQSVSQGIRYASQSLSTTRNGSRDFYASLVRSLLTTRNDSRLVLTSVRSRNIRPMLSLLLFCRPSGAYHVFQSYRLLLGYVGTGSVVSALVRSPTRFLVAFRSRSALYSLFLYDRNYYRSYETSTCSRSVSLRRGLVVRNSHPPLRFSY